MKRTYGTGLALGVSLALAGPPGATSRSPPSDRSPASTPPSAPSSRPAPNRRSTTSTPPAAFSARSSSFEFGDDASDPKQAVSVANQFVGKGVKFVVGDFCSGVVDSRVGVYTKTASCRSRRPRPIRNSPSAGSGTCSASAAVTTSRAWSPASSSPSTSRTRRSRSSTTRRPTAKALPTKPRRS